MKRPAEDDVNPDAKRQKFPDLRRQIEYYFSDDNLRRDKFFHNLISENPEGWLDMKFILSCKKITAMGAVTPDDLLEALVDSHLEARIDETTFNAVRRSAPLPQLRSQKPQGDLHGDGCILVVSGLPEEGSWVQVKDALKDLYGEKKVVRFVSQTTQDGRVFVLCNIFEGDHALLNQLKELNACGVVLQVSLIQNEADKNILWSQIPRLILKGMEKDRVRVNRVKERAPLLVGGVKFAHIDHLRHCLKEVLQTSELDTSITNGSNTENILKALTQYHPMRNQKMAGFASFKIASAEKETKEEAKAFHIVKEDETSESFSYHKCLQSMLKRLPIDPDAASSVAKVEDAETKKECKQENVCVKG